MKRQRRIKFAGALLTFFLASGELLFADGLNPVTPNKDAFSAWSVLDWQNAFNWYERRSDSCPYADQFKAYDPDKKRIGLALGCSFPTKLPDVDGPASVYSASFFDLGTDRYFLITVEYLFVNLSGYTMVYLVDGEDNHGLVYSGPVDGSIIPVAYGVDEQSLTLMIERYTAGDRYDAMNGNSEVLIENYVLEGRVLTKQED